MVGNGLAINEYSNRNDDKHIGDEEKKKLAEEHSSMGGRTHVRRLWRSLSERGVPFDRKKFSPHITLIRKVSYLNGIPMLEDIPGISTRVSRISLMRSERGKNGMIYTEIGEAGLMD